MTSLTRSSRSGLSLLEVALALAVLTFGIAGVVDLFLATKRTSSTTRARLAAESLAQQKSQELEAAGYDAALALLSQRGGPGAPRAAKHPDSPAPDKLPGTEGLGEGLACTWQTELEALPDAPDCIRGVTRVEWTDENGTRHVESQVCLTK